MRCFLKKILVVGLFALTPMLGVLGTGAKAMAAGTPGIFFRGWGLTSLSKDGYKCPLFAEDGSYEGTISYSFDAGGPTVLNTRDLSITFKVDADSVPISAYHSLEEAASAFPNLDDAVRQVTSKGYDPSQLEVATFAGRGEVSDNMQVLPRKSGVTAVEIRCVYIMDKETHTPLFCLNCMIFVS